MQCSAWRLTWNLRCISRRPAVQNWATSRTTTLICLLDLELPSLSWNLTCAVSFTNCLVVNFYWTRSILKMLGPFTTTSRLTPIQQMSLSVLLRAACASMSTTTTTTTTSDRGDRYGPVEWAQWDDYTLQRTMHHASQWCWHELTGSEVTAT